MAVRGRGRASLSYLFVDEAVEHAHQETLSEEERNQLAAVDSLFAAQSTVAVNGLVLGTEGHCLLAPSSLYCSHDPQRPNVLSVESNFLLPTFVASSLATLYLPFLVWKNEAGGWKNCSIV